MRIILIILAILLLLIGGLLGAYYGLGLRSQLPFLDFLPALEEEGPSEEELAERKAQYVKFRMLNIPIFKGQRVIRQAMVSMTLEVNGPTKASLIDEKREEIRHIALGELQGYLNLQWTESGTLDHANVKKRLKIVLDRHLGDGIVNEVLVPQFYVRR